MKMYLISDNTDTLTGMRLAGVEGILVRSRDQVKKALEDAVSDKDNGILLLTESLGKQYPDLVRITRTGHKMPLLIEIRTATALVGDRISSPHTSTRPSG